MKLTLTLLLVFGLIAFTVAAPFAEEAVEDPEHLEQDPEEDELNNDDQEMMGLNEFDKINQDKENDDVDVAADDPKKLPKHCRCYDKCKYVVCKVCKTLKRPHKCKHSYCLIWAKYCGTHVYKKNKI